MGAQLNFFGDDPPITDEEMLSTLGRVIRAEFGDLTTRDLTNLREIERRFKLLSETRRRIRRVEEIPADDWLLIEVRSFLRRNAERGVACSACSQFVKVYRRTFHATNARILLALYRHFEQHPRDEWTHLPTLLMSKGIRDAGGESAKMRFFGVVDLKADRSDQNGTNHSGLYRITKLGVDFARGEASIPKFVRIYDGEPLPRRADDRRDQETITIREALGSKFSYEELMRA